MCGLLGASYQCAEAPLCTELTHREITEPWAKNKQVQENTGFTYVCHDIPFPFFLRTTHTRTKVKAEGSSVDKITASSSLSSRRHLLLHEWQPIKGRKGFIKMCGSQVSYSLRHTKQLPHKQSAPHK